MAISRLLELGTAWLDSEGQAVMADINIHMDYQGFIDRIDVYADGVLIAYLEQDRDYDKETMGWWAQSWYGPMCNPARTLNTVRIRLDGCTMAEWEAGLKDWAAGLTEIEWEATLKTLYTEQIEGAVRSVAWTIGRDMEEVEELEPMSQAAANALATLTRAKQRLDDVVAAIGVPHPMPATGWTPE